VTLTGNTFIEGPAGRLEALLKEPRGPIRRAAIVCHPHPLFGGTMHNKVVYCIAKTFSEAQFATLRFNFRGVGRSQGQHDHGRGEKEDMRAVIGFVEEEYPEVELWLAGFSFGAGVMLRVASTDQRVRAFIAAGTPVSKHDFGELAGCARAKLFIQGEHDEFGRVEDLQRLFAQLSPPKRLVIIRGTDHFFEGRLDELGRALEEFIAEQES
jgi:hypothetical protein